MTFEFQAHMYEFPLKQAQVKHGGLLPNFTATIAFTSVVPTRGLNDDRVLQKSKARVIQADATLSTLYHSEQLQL